MQKNIILRSDIATLTRAFFASKDFVEMSNLDASSKYVTPSSKRKPKGLTRFQEKDTLFAKIQLAESIVGALQQNSLILSRFEAPILIFRWARVCINIRCQPVIRFRLF